MTLKLNGSSSGSVSIDAPASTTGGADLSYTLPNATTGGVIRTTTTPGAILQVVNTTTTATGTLNLATANQYYDIPNLNVSITPASSSNKILLTFHAFGESETNEHLTSFQVKRAISGGATTSITAPTAGNRISVLTMHPETYYGGDHSSTPSVGQVSNYLDAPSTTSAVTYTVQVRCHTADRDWFYNRTDADSDDNGIERGVSWITLMEVAA